MSREKTAIPDDLLQLSRRLEEWRRENPPRTRLPEPIWVAAAEMAQRHGLHCTTKIYAAIHWRAIPVAVYVAAQMTGPGHLTHTGRGDLVIGHHAGWPRRPGLQPLAA